VNAEYTSPATVALLKRVGRRVVEIPMATDIAGIRTAIVRMADVIGDRAKGEAAVAVFDARLSRLIAASTNDKPSPTALIYQINGIASGVGLLEDEALRISGFRNLAPALGVDRGGRVALEAIVMTPPDLFALAGPSDEYRTVVAETLAHPAISATMKHRSTIILPWRQWICGSPYIADAIETLVAARQRMAAGKPRS